MNAWIVGVSIAAGFAVSGPVSAQNTRASESPPASHAIALVDSTSSSCCRTRGWSAECKGDAFVYSSSYAGVRGAAQVQTAAGIVLYVGAVGATTSVAVQSILYDTGCAPVSVQQNGLVPVVATVNLSSTYPPPLSLQ